MPMATLFFTVIKAEREQAVDHDFALSPLRMLSLIVALLSNKQIDGLRRATTESHTMAPLRPAGRGAGFATPTLTALSYSIRDTA
jgi:hypothetical protein